MDTAMCPTHPAERALGNCARCGTFVCALDQKVVDGKSYCATCAARPDVDWLEAFRLRHWGKRDGFAWLFGLGALIQLASAASLTVRSGFEPAVVFLLAGAAIGAAWWLKVKAARWAALALIIGQAIFFATTESPGVLVASVVPLLVTAAVVTATRTRLFFEIGVSREELKKMWDLYANNQVARMALTTGILGLLVWPFAPIALICGIVGLARVDPAAVPPIGRKGSAIAGIVLGVIGMGIASAVIAANAL